MRTRNLCALILFIPIIVMAQAVAVLADDWKPVDPAELAMKASTVEKDADAEGILWEVHVTDEFDGTVPRTVLTHYIKIKIFTDRGRESQSKVDLEYLNSQKVTDIAGRTTRPDGSTMDLKKEDVFDRTIVKLGGIKVKAKSFAMPGVVPGCVIEYRWKEIHSDTLTNYVRLKFQRDIPIRLVKYYIKPFRDPNFPFGMRGQTFHGDITPWAKESNGYVSTTMVNVPAFREEPLMPPEYEVRPWMLVYYSEDKKLTPEKYWPQIGKERYEAFKSLMKVNDDVKRAAAEAVGDATAPDQKLQRIYAYCQTKIKNWENKNSGVTAEEREKLKDSKSPADTLKHGIGNGGDVDFLFAAMATAAGFEARIALLPDRGDTFFSQGFTDTYFLKALDIAIRQGDKWRLYDPGSYYLPYGGLRWQEESVPALVCDSKESAFVITPTGSPEESLKRRTAHLKLSEDGTLEGDVKDEYTGHSATGLRLQAQDESKAEREKELTDGVKARMSTAEVTDIKIEAIDDPNKPIVYAYHVKVPGYAERTGKRFFFQPGFFERGTDPKFQTSTRKYPVYFHYPWSEEDSVEIQLPGGFILDTPEVPQSLAAGNISKYDVRLQISKDGQTVVYRRKFFFGGGGNILFPPTAYAALKQVFDRVHEEDGYTLTLKLAAATAAH